MKKYNSILITIILIILSISFEGCYSFYNIPPKEYVNKKIERKLKITLINKKEIVVANPTSIVFVDQNKILIIENDSIKSEILINEIDKIQAEKFSFVKTFFGTFWISAATALVLFGILVSIYGPIQFG